MLQFNSSGNIEVVYPLKSSNNTLSKYKTQTLYKSVDNKSINDNKRKEREACKKEWLTTHPQVMKLNCIDLLRDKESSHFNSNIKSKIKT